MLLALAVVLMAFLGIASGVLILTRTDDRGGIAIGQPSAEPTDPPEQTALPEETPTPGSATLRPTPTLGPPGDFACLPDSQRAFGPAGTNWTLDQVDFRTYPSYDRIIYQLRRTGRDDDGIEPFVSVRHSIPGEGQYIGEPPVLSGDRRLHVVLANGVRDRTGLDAYGPRGMKIVESLSTQRYRSHINYYDPEDDPAMADIGTLSTIDVQGEGCFALRVVGWGGAGDDIAAVYVDIRQQGGRRTPPPTQGPRPSNAPPSLVGPVPGPPTEYTCSLEPTAVEGTGDLSRYRLYEVGFRTFPGYDRVIFRLRRTDTAASPPSAVARLLEPEALAAEALPPGVTAAVTLRLEGVSDGVRLDGYQPRGMRIVESVYTAGSGDTTYPNVLLSSDGCYQLRVPAWETTDPGASDPDLVDVFVDFRR